MPLLSFNLRQFCFSNLIKIFLGSVIRNFAATTNITLLTLLFNCFRGISLPVRQGDAADTHAPTALRRVLLLAACPISLASGCHQRPSGKPCRKWLRCPKLQSDLQVSKQCPLDHFEELLPFGCMTNPSFNDTTICRCAARKVSQDASE